MVEADFSFSFKIPNTGFRITGYSKDKTGSGIFVDDLSLGLGCGALKSGDIPKFVFLADNDIETFLYAPMLVYQAVLHRERVKTVFYVPDGLCSLLDNMIAKTIALGTTDKLEEEEYSWEVRPVKVGSRIHLDSNYYAHVFRTGDLSVGYAVYGICRRLKSEFAEYVLRNGPGNYRIDDVTDKAEYPLFAYVGGATPDTLQRADVMGVLRPFKNIIVECPHIERDPTEPNRTSFEGLKPIIEGLSDTIFILTRLDHKKSYDELKKIQLEAPPNVLFTMLQIY